eukprot:1157507-Pelagomonas_calceolata.AAC.5
MITKVRCPPWTCCCDLDSHSCGLPRLTEGEDSWDDRGGSTLGRVPLGIGISSDIGAGKPRVAPLPGTDGGVGIQHPVARVMERLAGIAEVGHMGRVPWHWHQHWHWCREASSCGIPGLNEGGNGWDD